MTGASPRDRLLVIGGAGAMGRWFARRLNPHFDVSIHDVDREAAERVSRREGYGLAEPGDAAAFDAVMLAVPVDAVEDVARSVAPEMSPGSLLLDVTSVKSGPVAAMREAAPDGVSVLGTHPMFGPTADDLRGQTVILTPVERDDWFRRVRDLLRGEGAHVEISTPERHDEMMSVIQGLTHFAYVSFGAALEQLDFDVAASRSFMSPVYEVMMDFAGRILGQNPALYAQIQVANPLNEESRGAMRRAADRLARLADSGDVDGFVEEMRSAAKHFGDTSSSLRKSDKLIRALIEERQELQASVGEQVAVRNVRTGAEHVGTLTSFRPDRITIGETGGEVELKTSNVRILPPEEVERWTAENLPLQTRDVAVVTRERADPDRLAAVAESVDGVWRAEAVDRYAGPQVRTGFVSVTVHLDILSTADAAAAEQGVRDAFSGLGLELR